MMIGFALRRMEVDQALKDLLEGVKAADLESQTLDFKEEADSVTRDGVRANNSEHNQHAAKGLAEAAACFANADGGSIVVGVDDKRCGPDALVGASLDPEWLRKRVWDLTQPHLTVEIDVRSEEGTRLLIVYIPSSFELHKVGRRMTHRIGTDCVDMHPDVQCRVMEERSGYDFSAEETAFTLADVSPTALERAREYLRAFDDRSRGDLANKDAPELLRRLGVLSASGRLKRAGALLFVGISEGAPTMISYKRRHVPGGSSLQRIDATQPLLEAFHTVKSAIDAVNDTVHLSLGSGVRPQVRIVPDGAVREAIVNALMHRDYRLPGPIDIEFVGTQIVVDSPGGFVTGIDEHNILSHPSKPRNVVLTGVFRSLRLAEQEGVGVDRMYWEMVRSGLELPSITDVGGRVRCVLLGGDPVEQIFQLLNELPSDARDDVDASLIVHSLLRQATINIKDLSPLLQRSESEALTALRRAESYGLVSPTTSTLRYKSPNFRFTDEVREKLRSRLPYVTTSARDAEHFILRYLTAKDTITSSDVQEILGVKPVQASRILRSLREAGTITLGSDHETGRGVFYRRGNRTD